MTRRLRIEAAQLCSAYASACAMGRLVFCVEVVYSMRLTDEAGKLADIAINAARRDTWFVPIHELWAEAAAMLMNGEIS